ncbi:ATP-binding cassette domain-containing protein [Mesorhizobium sp.]|uniref:ATP-binding cassette domain-containing protein n=1 Tax=Mesorhizobium sp. TaxID=1871066 RepID=UPI000FE8FD78|nr:ATP-binding cassette domain-containing protein [Mesorhizobium sp.]RWM19438.1 MAG: ATP-binding cassette domain-containing protein [Mesorhizobium sp.]RWM31231.1 MAG: ATP-binding cassette domain-containing protein [Mesorhizobium sp.]TIO72988.1 MAG: ATP-binding cassette domain-containing protein [Mesorhizobium sp.]TIO80966.1 MAG: ATP-binding cassette domain-containing protein [Mesorhizobium sp.]TJV47979.1 MAG: ATP-binding cassette domain-containing protein [Mesorhizobium sp.]
MTDMLALRSVSISIGDKPLISGLNLVVEPGTVATVMGPSGSGKSTLIAFIGGHLDPAFKAAGSVLIGNRDATALPPERRGIGILFQDDLLFPHLSVGANLAFGLTRSVVGLEARRARIAEALAEAGLSGFEDRDPATLSGGQRARIALMRTLLAAPKALLLDEPFSKLDSDLRREFRRFVFDRSAAKRLPVLLVTHDLGDARAAGGQVLNLGAA